MLACSLRDVLHSNDKNISTVRCWSLSPVQNNETTSVAPGTKHEAAGASSKDGDADDDDDVGDEIIHRLDNKCSIP